VSLLVYPGNSPSSADRVGEKKDRRTLSERQEGKKVRSLAESMLFYVGIPAVLLYPLGVLGLGIQLWRDPLFPYSRLDTVWIAVSLVPEKVVIWMGIRLLFFALISTAFGIGVSVLMVRGLIRLGREPAEVSAVGRGGPRRWMLYLLLLMPVAVVVLWLSIRVNNATEVALFVGFFVFSAGAGLVIGYVRWISAEESWALSMLAAYVGGIAAAACLAATQTPPLPLVQIRADREAPLACSEVPTDDMFVMLDRYDTFLYVYSKEGLLTLPDIEAEITRFRECQGYLDRE
jgi:hypothetical protein